VLDEADLLLSFGHEEDIGAIAAKLPRGCQCMLVSATARRVSWGRIVLRSQLQCARSRSDARPRYPGRLRGRHGALRSMPPLV
jgi:superfamily II DNA/RNA helicase